MVAENISITAKLADLAKPLDTSIFPTVADAIAEREQELLAANVATAESIAALFAEMYSALLSDSRTSVISENLAMSGVRYTIIGEYPKSSSIFQAKWFQNNMTFAFAKSTDTVVATGTDGTLKVDGSAVSENLQRLIGIGGLESVVFKDNGIIIITHY